MNKFTVKDIKELFITKTPIQIYLNDEDVLSTNTNRKDLIDNRIIKELDLVGFIDGDELIIILETVI